MTTDHLADASAGIPFLRALPGVDPGRIAVVGHSFGAQLAILIAERDSTIRAAIAFGAASATWEHHPELRDRLFTALGRTTVPHMIVHSANDSSTAPAYALAGELSRLSKPYTLKILGDHGHNAVFNAIPHWEADVFAFLDRYVKR